MTDQEAFAKLGIDSKKWTWKQQALLLRVNELKQTEIAKRVNRSYSSVNNWLSRPEVRAVTAMLQEEAIQRLSASVQESREKAITLAWKTIVELLSQKWNDRNTSPKANAAIKVLTGTGQLSKDEEDSEKRNVIGVVVSTQVNQAAPKPEESPEVEHASVETPALGINFSSQPEHQPTK